MSDLAIDLKSQMSQKESRSHQDPVDWYATFKKFDTDDDGTIPWNELKQKLETAGVTAGLSTAETERLVHDADKNMDDKIDFSEFCFLMSKAKHMRMTNIVLHAAQMVLPRSMRQEPFNYLQQYTCCPPPLFIPVITIAQIAVYVYYLVYHKEEPNLPNKHLVDSPLTYNPYRKSELWRFLTYMFIHIGLYHILFNSVVQVSLGVPLELVHKYWRIAIVYCAGVVAGSLASSVSDPKSYLAGASGGVYALLSAHAAHLVVNWQEMEFAIIRLIGLVIIIATDVGVALYSRYYPDPNDKTNISYSAHIGGFVAGLLMGIIVLRNFRLKDWERVVWWIALVGCVVLFSLCVTWNLLYPNVLS